MTLGIKPFENIGGKREKKLVASVLTLLHNVFFAMNENIVTSE